MPNLKYTFGAAPLQNPIAGALFLTQPWHDWFLELQKQFLVRWEDLSFPSQGIVAVGGEGTQPLRDANTGLLTFAANQDNVLVGAAEMRHRWLPGSVVRPHLHLRFPNAVQVGNTRWRFDYDIANIGEDFTNASGSYTTLTTITVANPDNPKRHVFGTFGDLTMTGFEESCVILWRLTRLGLSDAADDDLNAVTLLSFAIAYQVQKAGTVPELV